MWDLSDINISRYLFFLLHFALNDLWITDATIFVVSFPQPWSLSELIFSCIFSSSASHSLIIIYWYSGCAYQQQQPVPRTHRKGGIQKEVREVRWAGKTITRKGLCMHYANYELCMDFYRKQIYRWPMTTEWHNIAINQCWRQTRNCSRMRDGLARRFFPSIFAYYERYCIVCVWKATDEDHAPCIVEDHRIQI